MTARLMPELAEARRVLELIAILGDRADSELDWIRLYTPHARDARWHHIAGLIVDCHSAIDRCYTKSWRAVTWAEEDFQSGRVPPFCVQRVVEWCHQQAAEAWAQLEDFRQQLKAFAQ